MFGKQFFCYSSASTKCSLIIVFLLVVEGVRVGKRHRWMKAYSYGEYVLLLTRVQDWQKHFFKEQEAANGNRRNWCSRSTRHHVVISSSCRRWPTEKEIQESSFLLKQQIHGKCVNWSHWVSFQAKDV